MVDRKTFLISVPNNILQKIVKFQIREGISTRNAAINELLRIALKKVE